MFNIAFIAAKKACLKVTQDKVCVVLTGNPNFKCRNQITRFMCPIDRNWDEY